MKFILIIASLLVGSIAMATPAVNDKAQFTESTTDGTKVQTATYELELLSYDAQKKEYSMKVTYTSEGQSESQTNPVPEASLIADAQIQQILQGCAAFGGTSEKVTVPAGQFDACGLPAGNGVETGTIWITTVPFGVVKQVVTNSQTGLTTTLSLNAYKAGTAKP